VEDQGHMFSTINLSYQSCKATPQRLTHDTVLGVAVLLANDLAHVPRVAAAAAVADAALVVTVIDLSRREARLTRCVH